MYLASPIEQHLRQTALDPTANVAEGANRTEPRTHSGTYTRTSV